MSEEQAQVTKSKNEGRVAAGKKLAEWNRKNKENLLKNKKSSEPASEPASAQEPISPTSSQLVYGGGAALVVLAIFIFMKKSPTPTPAKVEPLKTGNDDLFRMN